jgi:hypothetical protein
MIDVDLVLSDQHGQAACKWCGGATELLIVPGDDDDNRQLVLRCRHCHSDTLSSRLYLITEEQWQAEED